MTILEATMSRNRGRHAVRLSVSIFRNTRPTPAVNKSQKLAMGISMEHVFAQRGNRVQNEHDLINLLHKPNPRTNGVAIGGLQQLQGPVIFHLVQRSADPQATLPLPLLVGTACHFVQRSLGTTQVLK